jgi:hypothetical protein
MEPVETCGTSLTARIIERVEPPDYIVRQLSPPTIPLVKMWQWIKLRAKLTMVVVQNALPFEW